MRRPILAFLAGVTAGFGVAIPASKAQEPLFLRIRPAGEAPASLGDAGVSDERVARDARARAQAVWDRADRRARIAIASICTGCLAPERAPSAASPVRPETVEYTVPAAAPPSSFAQTGAP
ncbi:hypothetical protein G3T14_16590 [Methylobacterium sp. BTF04]|uniref:hypothetical protein n=1 Tax=Methylobacterium sp. BTF04 TaxID=2708300 RepID=UPI0013D62D59|nr:hypothetical protein [Methylobacterium sp. BTF04]NEU13738.1 hypothetical protein [Methylobacterium sp. BTF04]